MLEDDKPEGDEPKRDFAKICRPSANSILAAQYDVPRHHRA